MRVEMSLRALALVASVSLFAGGCCCKKGLVLRGDWSLELNRVPHLLSNGPTYGGDCCDSIGCDQGCTSHCTSGCTCPNCLGGGVGGGRGLHGGYGGYGGAGGDDGPQPPEPSPAAQSRFHPVPTRPVFEPQHSYVYGPRLEGPPVPQASELPPPQASTSNRRRAQDRSTAAQPSPSLGAGLDADAGDEGAIQQVSYVVEPADESSTAIDTATEPVAESTPPATATRVSLEPETNTVRWRPAGSRCS